MTAEKKIAQKRLTLLQVAERIRNVSEACRRHSVSQSQFYEYKRAFQERGFDGLMDRPPIPRSFPNETPDYISNYERTELKDNRYIYGIKRSRIGKRLQNGHR